MCHHDRGQSTTTGGEDQPHDGLTVDRVQGTRGLVGEEELALTDHGPGDGDALALTAGELVGEVR